MVSSRGEEGLSSGPRCTHCVSTIRCKRDRLTPGPWLCRNKLLPSKLAVGLSRCIHHPCSTFSWACLRFFTEIPPLNLLMLGLSFAHPYYFALFLSDPSCSGHFLPYSSTSSPSLPQTPSIFFSLVFSVAAPSLCFLTSFSWILPSFSVLHPPAFRFSPSLFLSGCLPLQQQWTQKHLFTGFLSLP